MWFSLIKANHTPLEQNQKLISVDYDRQFNITDDDELEDGIIYQRLIRRLLYLAMIRPDISFVVLQLSQFMHAPKKSHYNATVHVVKYIKGQPSLGLLMSSRSEEELVLFVMLTGLHVYYQGSL